MVLDGNHLCDNCWYKEHKVIHHDKYDVNGYCLKVNIDVGIKWCT